MDEVSVLGVLEAEQRAIGGERAAEESAVRAPELNELGRAVHLPGWCAVE